MRDDDGQHSQQDASNGVPADPNSSPAYIAAMRQQQQQYSFPYNPQTPPTYTQQAVSQAVPQHNSPQLLTINTQPPPQQSPPHIQHMQHMQYPQLPQQQQPQQQQQYPQLHAQRINPEFFARLFQKYCIEKGKQLPQTPPGMHLNYYAFYTQVQRLGGFQNVRQYPQLLQMAVEGTVFASNPTQFLHFYQGYLYEFEMHMNKLFTSGGSGGNMRQQQQQLGGNTSGPSSPVALAQQRPQQVYNNDSQQQSRRQSSQLPQKTQQQQEIPIKPQQTQQQRIIRIKREVNSYGGVEVDKYWQGLSGEGECFTAKQQTVKEDIAYFDMKQIMMSLKCGLKTEINSALHTLLVLSFDYRYALPFDEYPGLMEALLDCLDDELCAFKSSSLYDSHSNDDKQPWSYKKLFEWEMEALDNVLFGNAFSQSFAWPFTYKPLADCWPVKEQFVAEELQIIDMSLKQISLILCVIRNWSFDNSDKLSTLACNQQLNSLLWQLLTDLPSPDCLSCYTDSHSDRQTPRVVGWLEIRKHLLICFGNLADLLSKPQIDQQFHWLLSIALDFVESSGLDLSNSDEEYLSRHLGSNAIGSSQYSVYCWYALDLVERLSARPVEFGGLFDSLPLKLQQRLLHAIGSQFPIGEFQSREVSEVQTSQQQQSAAPPPLKSRWYELSEVETALSTLHNLTINSFVYQRLLMQERSLMTILTHLACGSCWAGTPVFVRDPRHKQNAIYLYGLADIRASSTDPIPSVMTHFPSTRSPPPSYTTLHIAPHSFDSCHDPIIKLPAPPSSLGKEERERNNFWYFRFSVLALRVYAVLADASAPFQNSDYALTRPSSVVLLASSWGREDRYFYSGNNSAGPITMNDGDDTHYAATPVPQQQPPSTSGGMLSDYGLVAGEFLQSQTVGDVENTLMGMVINQRLPKEISNWATTVLYRLHNPQQQ